ncbi:hypothetical protein D0N73_10220 [Pseudomonas fluorescens]|nr:hypothetical protein D0N73_10220 [Pseudomonas fluorescens]
MWVCRSNTGGSKSVNVRGLNVGAGLLAKAVGHPIHVSPDTPHSRASPLPHLIFVIPGLTSTL